MRVHLDYGSDGLPVDVPDDRTVVVAPRHIQALDDPDGALAEALAHPTAGPPLPALVRAGQTVAISVCDITRAQPRQRMLEAIFAALPQTRPADVTILVATGTHRANTPEELERMLGAELVARYRVVNHDARDEGSMVEVGRTSRGTRLRVSRCVVEADVIVSTGRVKPHYFAGYGGGAKGIFPGLGHDDDIRQNHKLKADPASSLGRADGNPCREDLEEAVRRIGRDTFLVNVVEAGGTILGAVAGDLVLAHRQAVRLLRPWVEVTAEPADVVIVSAPLPVSGSLYQASKLVPPAGLLLKDGGVVIVAAECPDGTGPLKTVNEGIFALGVRRFLPERYTLLLVSSMDEATVAQTYARYAPSLEAALAEARRITGPSPRIVVMPDAGDLVPVRPG